MVDWTSPTELASEGVIFKNLMHALIGLYAWEFLTSLDFEWELLTGKKRFRWPLVSFTIAGVYLRVLNVSCRFSTLLVVTRCWVHSSELPLLSMSQRRFL
jgi:hypothetical protein